MNRNDNIVDGIDFSDCIEAMRSAFREKLNNERRRWNDNNNKKLNINIQLHMTIEKK